MKHLVITVVLAMVAGIGGLIVGLALNSHWADSASAPPHRVAGTGTLVNTSRLPLAGKAKPQRKILYWWDPMIGPASISPKPGTSSMGMALIPVYAPTAGAFVPGEVRVDPAMVQNMGIQTAKVTLGPLKHPVRTVGYLRVAAPQRYSITIRAGGWIGKLYATTNGTAIAKGQKLFTLYSPRIVAAEEQLVAAQKALLAARKRAGRSALREAQALVKSVELRLAYLGVNAPQIRRVETSLRALTYVTFHSPISGALVKIAVRQKARINAGMTALQINNLSSLWLDSQVFENQLSWIRMGERVTATLAAFPGRLFHGKIIFIDAYENRKNHTTAVRMKLRNSAGKLRPGMYALADIQTQPVRRAILVPRRAVIHTGTGALVFVQISRGHFTPVKVTTGLTGEHGWVQVLSGIGLGQTVLTSGQFAIDVESALNQIKARFMRKLPTAGPKAARSAAGKARVAPMRMAPSTRRKMPAAGTHGAADERRPGDGR